MKVEFLRPSRDRFQQYGLFADHSRRFAKILHVFMTHAPPFGAYASVKHVVGVTRVAGFVGWNTVILEVSCREIMDIVDVEALTERLHDMA